MSAGPAVHYVCPRCGADRSGPERQCWLCGSDAQAVVAADVVDEQNPYASPRGANSGSTFTLSSLFLVTTAAAVCMGLGALAPGLGIPLGVVSVVALANRKPMPAHSLTTGEKVAAFLGSVGLVIVAFFAASIAFLGACFITCMGAAALDGSGVRVGPNGPEGLILVGISVGALAAIVMGIVVLKTTWPQRQTTRRVRRSPFPPALGEQKPPSQQQPKPGPKSGGAGAP